MPPKKKQGNQGDFKQEDVLQAIVIADSFNTRFAPITSNKPRCLLPLANVPVIDYTLEFLNSAGIQETFIFVCSHADQVKAHIAKRWSQSEMDVQVLVSEDCLSAGDALRDIDAKSVIHSDFVLINGDLVSNVKLIPLIEQHKAQRLKEKTPVMTMLYRKAPPGHRTRCKEDDLVIAVQPSNAQLLFHQRASQGNALQLPVELLLDHVDVELHYDLLDCHISICSPHVLPLFTDEFDFLTRDHFVKGILVNEEILGHTIHVKIIEEEYAARVSNLQMYDAISQDILSRWTYPFTPDGALLSTSDSKCSHSRHNIYLQEDVTLARGCTLEENVAIGQGTVIGSKSRISHSVIGSNCSIGNNVRLENAYILNNVTVGDDCVITTSLLDDGVKVMAGVKVHSGCVLAKKVVIGNNSTLRPATRLMAEAPTDDFDDTPGAIFYFIFHSLITAEPLFVCDLGAAYEYKESADDDEEVEDLSADLWGLRLESDEDAGDDWEASDYEGDSDDMNDDFGRNSPEATESDMFLEEVIGTLERGIAENISTENIVLEVNSLKHAYGIQIKEVNMLVTQGVLDLPLKDMEDMPPQQRRVSLSYANFKKFLPLLRNYIKNAESQLNCLLSIEDLCSKKSVLMQVFMKLIHMLYETEVLAEEVITTWYNTKTEDANGLKCRKEIGPFVKWLQEAEEESDEDESD
ncbi:hypothetical protein CAPTEDRAFT_153443 [Capitella teleta]|uniref:Translation initiation factor eIF2B subunit epsilon n=1 Tax=Capitella teleta TaxID=283909 RepID=R7U1E9_CAPTE|nr:hypothetical protein CAPTEDRAFT_153443 [Capitella teleta]|eukprot:ELU00049.1 hypothetical protein CAPTEDRAFT_153443 [Capitella teleta]